MCYSVCAFACTSCFLPLQAEPLALGGAGLGGGWGLPPPAPEQCEQLCSSCGVMCSIMQCHAQCPTPTHQAKSQNKAKAKSGAAERTSLWPEAWLFLLKLKAQVTSHKKSKTRQKPEASSQQPAGAASRSQNQ
jgi:hypothetical protein